MWLSCHTQEEIAEAVGLSQPQVKEILSGMAADLPKLVKPYAEHLVDFDVLNEEYKKKGRKDIDVFRRIW